MKPKPFLTNLLYILYRKKPVKKFGLLLCVLLKTTTQNKQPPYERKLSESGHPGRQPSRELCNFSTVGFSTPFLQITNMYMSDTRKSRLRFRDASYKGRDNDGTGSPWH
jgi:hypothetical protein